MNKSFFIGFLLGMLLTGVIAMGGLNYYVNQKVEATKQEAKKNLVQMKALWEEEYKEKTTKLLQEKKDALLQNIYDRMKGTKDTTATNSTDSLG